MGLFRTSEEGERGLFEGDIYYPYKNLFAYSEMFYISVFVILPVKFITQNLGVLDGLLW